MKFRSCKVIALRRLGAIEARRMKIFQRDLIQAANHRHIASEERGEITWETVGQFRIGTPRFRDSNVSSLVNVREQRIGGERVVEERHAYVLRAFYGLGAFERSRSYA